MVTESPVGMILFLMATDTIEALILQNIVRNDFRGPCLNIVLVWSPIGSSESVFIRIVCKPIFLISTIWLLITRLTFFLYVSFKTFLSLLLLWLLLKLCNFQGCGHSVQNIVRLDYDWKSVAGYIRDQQRLAHTRGGRVYNELPLKRKTTHVSICRINQQMKKVAVWSCGLCLCIRLKKWQRASAALQMTDKPWSNSETLKHTVENMSTAKELSDCAMEYIQFLCWHSNLLSTSPTWCS